MSADQILLIDLSSLAHPIWHMSQNEPDPNHTSQQIVARVRALASQHPHAAICCDSGRSFRHDIDPTYKGQRPEKEAVLMHQIQLAEEALRKEGYPVWKVKGAEADDIIATAVKKTLAIDGTSVLIATADKDLLQLVGPRVQAKSTAPAANGAIRSETDVITKYGIKPTQLLDWLSLVGDPSDNIKGAENIGEVKATALLREFGTLEAAYAAMAKGVVPSIKPAMRASLTAFKERWPVVRSLIALKSDVDIPFEEIATERTAPAMSYEPSWEATPMEEETGSAEQAAAGVSTAEMDAASEHAETLRQHMAVTMPSLVSALSMDKERKESSAAPSIQPAMAAAAKANGRELQPETEHQRPALNAVARQLAIMPPIEPTQLARLEPAPAPAEWDKQLEPRSMSDAVQLAQRMFDSKLFSAFGTPQAVLATVLAGRELGMPAMASLRNFFIIEGKPTLSSAAIQALVLRSGRAKYFRCTERTTQRSTFETQRSDDPPFTLSYTVEEAKQAWRKDQKAWDASGWGKHTADMLVARAASKLARLVYPDVVAGLYDPSEIE